MCNSIQFKYEIFSSSSRCNGIILAMAIKSIRNSSQSEPMHFCNANPSITDTNTVRWNEDERALSHTHKSYTRSIEGDQGKSPEEITEIHPIANIKKTTSKTHQPFSDNNNSNSNKYHTKQNFHAEIFTLVFLLVFHSSSSFIWDCFFSAFLRPYFHFHSHTSFHLLFLLSNLN